MRFAETHQSFTLSWGEESRSRCRIAWVRRDQLCQVRKGCFVAGRQRRSNTVGVDDTVIRSSTLPSAAPLDSIPLSFCQLEAASLLQVNLQNGSHRILHVSFLRKWYRPSKFLKGCLREVVPEADHVDALAILRHPASCIDDLGADLVARYLQFLHYEGIHVPIRAFVFVLVPGAAVNELKIPDVLKQETTRLAGPKDADDIHEETPTAVLKSATLSTSRKGLTRKPCCQDVMCGEILGFDGSNISEEMIASEIHRVGLLAIDINLGRKHTSSLNRLQTSSKTSDASEEIDESKLRLRILQPTGTFVGRSSCRASISLRGCSPAQTWHELGSSLV
mmetsp:Transcript_28269/g.60215  ORF Transcript_28269/g.60215 Transcript_28269/m.60215 type:complete len:335 (+) Transcript_28269:1249-2253(+)